MSFCTERSSPIGGVERNDKRSPDSFLMPDTNDSVVPWPSAEPLLERLDEALLPHWWDD